MAFDQNVFVNCPFDEEYLPLLRPLLFTIVYLGFRPRIALRFIGMPGESPKLTHGASVEFTVRSPHDQWNFATEFLTTMGVWP